MATAGFSGHLRMSLRTFLAMVFSLVMSSAFTAMHLYFFAIA